jgi:hypothetical protein
MTQLELTIKSLEAAIRETQTALMRPRNARDRKRNKKILLGLEQDLKVLKAQHLEECIKAATESFKGVDTDEFGNLMRGNE